MKRIFVENIALGKHKLNKADEHYIKTVLRYHAGDEIILFDGINEALGTYDGKNIQITKMLRENVSEPTLKLAIAQIKQPRFEWLIEKATELGVSEIFLLDTKFSQNQIRNLERIKKIAIESARQCNRVTIPIIHGAMSLEQFIQEHKHETWIFGHLEKNNENVCKNSIGIIIGPEGGFEENETKKLLSNFHGIKLSHNILRAETAAIAGLVYISQSR